MELEVSPMTAPSLPEFDESTRFFDLEGNDIPLSFSATSGCRRWDTNPPRWVDIDKLVRNGIPISRDKFMALVARAHAGK
jgi:hypothetical protein